MRKKRDFSTAQADTFAGSERKGKASACFGRNDSFWASAVGGGFAEKRGLDADYAAGVCDGGSGGGLRVGDWWRSVG
jgi:hypothetical protein